jgi:hypothetical protein
MKRYAATNPTPVVMAAAVIGCAEYQWPVGAM